MNGEEEMAAEAARAHDYFPADIRIPKLYATENTPDPMVMVKLFAPVGAATWYFTEYDPEQDLGFGWVDLGNGTPELGYTSIAELRAIRLMGGHVRIERDLYWTPRPLSEVKRLSEG